MAIAKTVVRVESTKLEWLEIEDSEGATWRYALGQSVSPDTTVHVDGQVEGDSIRAVLAREADGIAILRQDGPGLPDKIVVHYVSPAPQGPMPVIAFWKGKVEYMAASAP